MEVALLTALVALNLGVVLLFLRVIRHVPPHAVLVVTTPNRVRVVRRAAVVFPFMRAETLDTSDKVLTISCCGKLGAHASDDIRVDVVGQFTLRLPESDAQLLEITARIGCERAANADRLAELLAARFEDALRSVVRERPFELLHKDRITLADRVREHADRDLSGFVLAAVAVPTLEQTPLELLDPNHVLDAVGIAKITADTIREREHIAQQSHAARLVQIRLDHDLKTAEAVLAHARALAELSRHGR